jgi:putative intracellular protease/amidase
LAVESLDARDLPAAMSVGMNLDWITDYAPAWVFKDAFQQSRTWQSQEFNTATRVTNFQSTRSVRTDANGWPTALDTWTNGVGQLVQQRAVAVMYLGTNGAHPAGVYHARWRGDAMLSFYGDARVLSQGVLPTGERFADLSVTPSNNGTFLRIDSMSSADPIRDLHVWLPDYNGQSFVGQVWHPGDSFSPFHPLFVERLEPFDTIRFMQPSDTNTSDVVHWSDSRPLSYHRQSTFATDFQNGMSPEYMIELANELDANPWFNMPHAADDDYVRHFATLVRDALEPGRTAYVEWSNEVWNWAPGFEGHYWARAQAAAEGIRIEDVVARETRRDFAIWSEVFAGQTDRLVRVVGGFTPGTGQYGWNNQVMSRMNGEFDALAVAPYVAPPQTVRATYTSATTVDQVLADTRANIAPVADMVRQDASLVRQYETRLGRDLKFLSYEGGTHLDVRGGESYQRAFFDAAADPRMYGVVSDYLTAMAEAGLDSLNYYKFTDRRVPALMNSDFGTLNRTDQPLTTAHRYRALTDYIAAHPTVPPPAVVTIRATDPTAGEIGGNTATFTVTRAGGQLTQPLTVGYTVGGTATAGRDYVALSGSVVIPAGATSAAITVTPVDDPTDEPDETVTLTLRASTAYQLGSTTAGTATIADNDEPAALKPVLMVIANQDFYYQEYSHTREELERAGVSVVVAAATRTFATPHWNSGQPAGGGTVMPDIAVADVSAANYSAIVFVGGWGASSYQYAFSGTYANAAYNGAAATELAVNALIGDFVHQGKYVAAICHGVSVLAWARVDGASPIAGRTVVAYAGTAPPSNVAGSTTTRWHVEANGATMLGSRSVGDPTTAADDVVVDGRIITAENYDSARQFGRVIAARLRS